MNPLSYNIVLQYSAYSLVACVLGRPIHSIPLLTTRENFTNNSEAESKAKCVSIAGLAKRRDCQDGVDDNKKSKTSKSSEPASHLVYLA